jgi:ketosteroid isomerase-like protein
MAARDDDADTLRSMLSAWSAAIQARDLDGVIHDRSANILLFDVVPPLQSRGLDAYRASWREFFSWMGADGSFAIDDVAITAGDRVAFATALISCAGYEGGTRVAFDLRLTVGFEKVGDRWLVVHEHHSEAVLPQAGGSR